MEANRVLEYSGDLGNSQMDSVILRTSPPSIPRSALDETQDPAAIDFMLPASQDLDLTPQKNHSSLPPTHGTPQVLDAEEMAQEVGAGGKHVLYL